MCKDSQIFSENMTTTIAPGKKRVAAIQSQRSRTGIANRLQYHPMNCVVCYHRIGPPHFFNLKHSETICPHQAVFLSAFTVVTRAHGADGNLVPDRFPTISGHSDL